MLVLVASWGFLAAASFVIGSAVLSVTNIGRFDRATDRYLLATWTGTLAIASAFLALSVFTPLAPSAGPVLAVVLSGSTLIVSRVRHSLREAIHSLSPWTAVGVVVLTFGVAFYSSQQVTLYDTGLYHAGAIEWLSRYGSVKGVALLEFRLGFTSSWFALAAVFDWGILTSRIGTLTGGYAMLLASAHFVIVATRVARGVGRLSDWFACLAYLVVLTWLLRTGLSISPTPDVAVIALGVVVPWSIVSLSADEAPGSVTTEMERLLPAQAVPVLISAGAISIKPTAAPLLLASVIFYLWVSRPNRRQLLAVTAISALLALPTFLVSLTTSGCPIFPSPLLCANFPWSVSGHAAAIDQAIGRDFLRWTGSAPASANSWNWLPHWAGAETLGSVLIVYMVASTVALAGVAKRIGLGASGWVVSLALVGVTYVLVLSPTLRFMLAYLVLPPAYLGALAFSRLHPFTLVPSILAAIASVGTATIYDHTNDLTPSAIAFTLIMPVAAVAVAGGHLGHARIEARRYSVRPLRGLQFPALGLIVGVIFAVSNYSLLPRTRHPRVTTEQLASMLLPPLLPTLAGDQRIQHSANGFSYVSPPPGLQVCWALIPCTTDSVPSDLHLLDPKKGFAAGFAES